MAVVIKGSGTVEGISVGGLPDGIVDTDMLAANAVVTGKITDGTIVSGDIADSASIFEVEPYPGSLSPITLAKAFLFLSIVI